MAITFIGDGNSELSKRWQISFKRYFPDKKFYSWPFDEKKDDVEYVLAWQPPRGIWGLFPRLRAVFILGAGVDYVLSDKTFPTRPKLVRLVDGGMAKPMAAYVLYATLFFQRQFDRYMRSQSCKTWEVREFSDPREWCIGVMGLGAIGEKIADCLSLNGFPVIGWSRTKNNASFDIFIGADQLKAFLARTKVLVNVLPLTAETEKIINKKNIYVMPRGGFLINVGRGKTVDEKDLCESIEDGHLSGAFLDVFAEEPLPAEHPFYSNSRIFITPHVAAPTIFREAESQVIQNIKLIEAGKKPRGLVDRDLGY